MLDPMSNNDLALVKTPTIGPHNDGCMCMANLADVYRVLRKAHTIQALNHIKLIRCKSKRGKLLLALELATRMFGF